MILTYRKAWLCFPTHNKSWAFGKGHWKASFTVNKTRNIFWDISMSQSRRVMSFNHMFMVLETHLSHHWLVGTKVDTGLIHHATDSFPRYYRISHWDVGFTVMSRIFYRCHHLHWQFTYQTRNFAHVFLTHMDSILSLSTIKGTTRVTALVSRWPCFD